MLFFFAVFFNLQYCFLSFAYTFDVAPYPGCLTPVFVAVTKAGEVLQVTRARVRSEYEATH